MWLRSLSLFVVLFAVSNGGRYCNIKTIVNLDELSAVSTTLIRCMNDDFFNKLVHNLRCKLCQISDACSAACYGADTLSGEQTFVFDEFCIKSFADLL